MNTATAVVRARVEPKLRDDAEAVLDRLGLSMSDAIRMYLCQIRDRKGIPFLVEIPNAETLQSIRDLEEGRYETAHSIGELMEKLNS
jgi:DNA-damage-inducible protein J